MPDNAPSIYPALRYRDASAAIEWLARAFGFEKLFAAPGPDGAIAHAELRFGTGVIMLGSAKPEQGWKSPRDLEGVNQTLYVYVADLDAHYEQATAAGAEVVYAPRATEYGSREYGARDLEGHHWSFGTYRPATDG